MGNLLLKDYNIEKEVIAEGGQNNLWKIYEGRKKDQSKRPVSIFIYDKKGMDKNMKASREDIYIFMRKEVQTLQKFRHPNILGVVEPLLEDDKNMVFVTEPIQSTLSTMVKRNDSQFYQSELQIKMHLEEILETLAFLHADVKVTHSSLSPENIYVGKDGKYKLGGFIFSSQIIDTTSSKLVDIPNIDFKSRKSDSYIRFYPNLRFSAPEIIEQPSKCHFKSDIFSLGILILMMYRCKNSNNTNDPFIIDTNDKNDYENLYNKAKYQLNTEPYFQIFSKEFQMLINRMLNSIAQQRPSIQEIMASDWLNDPHVKAIKHLDKITEMDQNQQVNFLKGFQKILFKYDSNILKDRIIGQLLELIKFPYLVPVILGIILDIMNHDGFLSLEFFNQKILPTLTQIIKGKQISAQGLFLLVKNIGIIFKFVEKKQIEQDYIPIILKCYECNVFKLQECSLNQTPLIIEKVDYSCTKNMILPRVLQLCQNKSLALRKISVKTLQKVFTTIDKSTLQEQVLGTLNKMRTLGTDSEMTKIILDIYINIAQLVSLEVIGTKLLPQLIPYLMDQALGKQEFLDYCDAVKKMVNLIQEERLKTIQDKDIEYKPKNDAEAAQFQQNDFKIDNGQNDFEFLNQFNSMNQAPVSHIENKQPDLNQKIFGKRQSSTQSNQNLDNQGNNNNNHNNNVQQQINKPQKNDNKEDDFFNNLQQDGQNNDPFFQIEKQNNKVQYQQKQGTTKIQQKNEQVDDFFNVKSQNQQYQNQLKKQNKYDNNDFFDDIDQEENRYKQQQQKLEPVKQTPSINQQYTNKNNKDMDDDLWGQQQDKQQVKPQQQQQQQSKPINNNLNDNDLFSDLNDNKGGDIWGQNNNNNQQISKDTNNQKGPLKLGGNKNSSQNYNYDPFFDTNRTDQINQNLFETQNNTIVNQTDNFLLNNNNQSNLLDSDIKNNQNKKQDINDDDFFNQF